MFNTISLMNVLPTAFEGWLQVFAVILLIIAATYLLNKFTSDKGDK
ncbi:MAG: hypothetical protein PUB42_07500 [Firmicutes bacterium]|nr:hypothetical protein [Bacillota bacterium]